MADDNPGPSPRTSWHERETLHALQRLTAARANLATLEEQDERVRNGDVGGPVEADATRVNELEAEIERRTPKAEGRFGGSSARSRIEECRSEQQAIFERVGVADLQAFHELAGQEPIAPVDAAVLDFARRECADAEKGFLEVAAMVIPDVEPEADAPETDELGAADDDLDLRIEPFAAS